MVTLDVPMMTLIPIFPLIQMMLFRLKQMILLIQTFVLQHLCLIMILLNYHFVEMMNNTI